MEFEAPKGNGTVDPALPLRVACLTSAGNPNDKNGGGGRTIEIGHAELLLQDSRKDVRVPLERRSRQVRRRRSAHNDDVVHKTKNADVNAREIFPVTSTAHAPRCCVSDRGMALESIGKRHRPL